MMIDSSSAGLDRLHRRLSRRLGDILHSQELSRSTLEALLDAIGNGEIEERIAVPDLGRPGADAHDLLVGATASVVHDWWMLPENENYRPPDPPPAEWSDDILDRASSVFEVLYEAGEQGLDGSGGQAGGGSHGGKTTATIKLSEPLGMGLTPDGTVLRTTPGGQAEAGGVQVGAQIVSVDGETVSNLAGLKACLAAKKSQVGGPPTCQVVFFTLPELHDPITTSTRSAPKPKRSGPPPTEFEVCVAAYTNMAHRRAEDAAANGASSSSGSPLAFEALPLEEQLRALVVARVCRRMAEVAVAASGGPQTPTPAAAAAATTVAAGSTPAAAVAEPAGPASATAVLSPPSETNAAVEAGAPSQPLATVVESPPLPEEDDNEGDRGAAWQRSRISTSTALQLNTGPIPSTPPVASVDFIPADHDDLVFDDRALPRSPPSEYEEGNEGDEGEGGAGNTSNASGGGVGEDSFLKEGASIMSASTDLSGRADEEEESFVAPGADEGEEGGNYDHGDENGGDGAEDNDEDDDDEDGRDIALETTIGRAAAMADLLDELVASAEALRGRAATEVVEENRDRLEAEAERAYHEVLGVDSACSAAHVGLGELYLSQGLIADAGKCFASALDASPQLAAAHNGWGRHLALLLSSSTTTTNNDNDDGERARQRAEAIASLEEACALEPSNLQFVADLEDFTSGPAAGQEEVEGGPRGADVGGGTERATNDDFDEDALWAAAAEEVRADEEAREMASRIQEDDDEEGETGDDHNGAARQGDLNEAERHAATGDVVHDEAPASALEPETVVEDNTVPAPAPAVVPARTLSRRSRSSSSSSSGAIAAATPTTAAPTSTDTTTTNAATSSSRPPSSSSPPPPDPPLLHAPASPPYSPAGSPEPSREPSPAPLPQQQRRDSASPDQHTEPVETPLETAARHTPPTEPSPPLPGQQSPPESPPLSPADLAVSASSTTVSVPADAASSPPSPAKMHLHHPPVPSPTASSAMPAHSGHAATTAGSSSSTMIGSNGSSSSSGHQMSAAGRWGEVQLLGGEGAWKNDARRFLAETFGFAEVTDYDALPAVAEKHSTVKPVVVLVYLGEGQRGGAAAVDAAALIASSSSSSSSDTSQQRSGSNSSGVSNSPQVVLVVQDVSAQALAMAESVHVNSISAHEVNDLTAQRQCLRHLAASCTNGFAHVADNLNASLFKAIDLLSPANGERNSSSTSHGASQDHHPSTPHKWRPIAGAGATTPGGVGGGGGNASTGIPANASSTASSPGADATAAAADAAHAAALAAMQTKHDAEMAAMVEAHEAQLKIATKTLQQEAALQDRRAGRTPTGGFFGNGARSSGSSSPVPSSSAASMSSSSLDRTTPTAAAAGAGGFVGVGGGAVKTADEGAAAVVELQAKLETAVRGREVAVLRAQRSEFLRALFHLGKRAGRESLLIALLRWKKQVVVGALDQVVEELLKQHKQSAAATRLAFVTSTAQVSTRHAKASLQRYFWFWAACAGSATCNLRLEAQEAETRLAAASAREQASAVAKLQKQHLKGLTAMAGERDKYKARASGLADEVAELNAELEVLYEKHGQVKRQLLVLRHSSQHSNT